MNRNGEGKCPCCSGSVDYFPGQDGSYDHYCTHCSWREQVPGSDAIAAALTLQKGENTSLRPTVVVWVEGGLVQGVEANATVRVLVCDFDCEEQDASRIGDRPCVVSDWDRVITKSCV